MLCYCRKFARKFSETNAHDDGIWCVAWGKFEKENAEIIATGSVDDKIKIWGWARDNLELKHTCEGHQLGVVSVDLNKSGSTMASSSLDAMIKIWDIETGKSINTIDASPGNS